jgi:hypothetical protein
VLKTKTWVVFSLLKAKLAFKTRKKRISLMSPVDPSKIELLNLGQGLAVNISATNNPESIPYSWTLPLLPTLDGLINRRAPDHPLPPLKSHIP